MPKPDPEKTLAGFIKKFAPPNQRLLRGIRTRLRARLPGANELVYDNYNFLVIAYCPTEKTSDSWFSIGADKHGANLFFGYTGSKLADPKKLLQGSGAKNRFLRLASAEHIDHPDVRALVDASIAVSKPMGDAPGRLLIRMVSPKQRPRR